MEECEALEAAAVDELSKPSRSHRASLLQDYRVARAFDAIRERARAIQKLRSLGDLQQLDAFYTSIANAREYHRKYPQARGQDLGAVDTVMSFDEADLAAVASFSGEERYGRALDLHVFHSRYLNLTEEKVTYRAFLDSVSRFNDIDASVKGSKRYAKYVYDLRDYLIDFKRRALPLTRLNVDKVEENFEASLRSGEDAVDLGTYADAAALEALGSDRLGRALRSRGLKCGGSLSQRAARLFSVKGVARGDYPKKLLAKKSTVALAEYTIQHLLANDLCDCLHAAKELQVKKQTQTYKERQADLLEEDRGDVAESDLDVDSDDDPEIYNPLNVPLGWDGKPIPLWLYKLHGLGTEYKCEICGNFSYWGRRSYDFHFREWRHEHGMKCLGIPNTKHFHDIVKIADAQKLYAKLKRELGGNFSEEVEDAEGNVMTKQVYNDLAKQGLI